MNICILTVNVCFGLQGMADLRSLSRAFEFEFWNFPPTDFKRILRMRMF